MYCIKSDSTPNLIYIGSTIQPLSIRFRAHKTSYKRWKNSTYNYTSSYEIIKFEDCYIQLIEDYPCDSKKDLCKREGEYIRNMTTVNQTIPGRTNKQYKKDNKEQIAKHKKEYYNDNKDKITQYKKYWYETNKEEITQYHKEYNDVNKDKIAQRKKERISTL